MKLLNSRFPSKLLAYPARVLELLLLVCLLMGTILAVNSWPVEPVTGNSMFDSPLPTPGLVLIKKTPTPRPDPALDLTFTHQQFYLSVAEDGSVGSISNAGNEDILWFDGATFSLYFDGSDVGVDPINLAAFTLLDATTMLMSFSNPITLSSLGVVNNTDIVQFEATSLGTTTTGMFSLYFDGSDVDLTTADEAIDGLDILSTGQLLISTVSSVTVSGVSGAGEDILIFTPATLGDNTAGTWALYFDGSDVGLTDAAEKVNGLALSTSSVIYLTTTGSFSTTVIAGDNEDAFVCIPTALGEDTACTYSSALSFDGSIWGLSGNAIDAIDPLP